MSIRPHSAVLVPLLAVVLLSFIPGSLLEAAEEPEATAEPNPAAAEPEAEPGTALPPFPGSEPDSDPDSAPDPPTAATAGVLCAYSPDEKADDEAGSECPAGKKAVNLADRLVIWVGSLPAWLTAHDAEPHDLRLFLNGVEITDLEPEAVQQVAEMQGVHAVRYRLSRTTDNRDSWRSLLGPFDVDPRRMTVGLGLAGDLEMDETSHPSIDLQTIRPWWLAGWGLLLCIFLLCFWHFQKLRDSLRDRQAEGTPKPFSLALVQMACWFFLVVAAFGFLWMALGDLETITPSILALIGISAGTALGASMVDSGKKAEEEAAENQRKLTDQRLQADTATVRQQADAMRLTPELTLQKLAVDPAIVQRKAELDRAAQRAAKAQGAVKQGSRGLLADILSDRKGISFHRLQMLVWTLVLAIIFIVNVVQHLAMPDFSDTLLGLLGISAGTYVGFKLPERFEPAAAPESTPQPNERKPQAEKKAESEMEASDEDNEVNR